MSDQMLMAGYILQAFEHGGMPMHASGYRELAAWAVAELATFDIETLCEMRHGVPGALLAIVENSLCERLMSSCPVSGLLETHAQTTCRALLDRFRVHRPA